MENKSSSDQPINENLGQESDNTENNEVLSEAAAATEISISTDKAAVDEKPEPSPIKSESTSGLEMVSRSTTSDSEIPCERGTSNAEKKPEPSPLLSEPTSGLEMVSRSKTDSEIPCEVATSDAGKKPEPSPLLSEPTSGIELISRSSTTASEIPSEGVETSDKEKKPEPTTLSPDVAPELEPKSVQSEGTNTVERNTGAISTPPKKSFIGQAVSAVKSVLSPPKSGKSKANRSKSMSPSKSQSDGDNSKPVPEEACVASESEEYSKKENDTVYRKLKRKWSKFKLGSKPSSESANLVSNEEIDRNEETSTSKLDNQPEQISSDLIVHECQWVDNSLSLTDRPTYDGTTMTDIPSICSAGDVFPSDSSKKSSEIGENTSEEAVAGSLVSSPDEVPDIKKDKDGECKMKDGSSNDQNVVEVESENTTKDVPSIDKETLNIVVEKSKENQSILKNGQSIDSANVAENSKVIQPISKDDPSTVKEIDEIVAEDSKEKQSAEKDSESRNDKD